MAEIKTPQGLVIGLIVEPEPAAEKPVEPEKPAKQRKK